MTFRITNGSPKPTITWWYKDANSTEYAAIPDSSADFLRVEHIQLSAAGHYKCVARNTIGQTDKEVQIIVEGMFLRGNTMSCNKFKIF